MTQEQVGKLFTPAISRESVSLWEANKSRPDMSRLQTLARAYRKQITELLGYQHRDLKPGNIVQQEPNVYPGPEIEQRVPLVSWVRAGAFSSATDTFHPGDAEEWLPSPIPVHQHTYALRVRGDSMEPTFPDGWIIYVEPDAIDTLEKLVGLFVIVKRVADDEATFKQLVRDGGVFYLKPLNPRYPMLALHEGDTLCGVVRFAGQRFF